VLTPMTTGWDRMIDDEIASIWAFPRAGFDSRADFSVDPWARIFSTEAAISSEARKAMAPQISLSLLLSLPFRVP